DGPDGRQHDGQAHGTAEQGGAHVHSRDVAEDARAKGDSVDRLAVAPEGRLGLRAARHVVPGAHGEVLLRRADELVQGQESVLESRAGRHPLSPPSAAPPPRLRYYALLTRDVAGPDDRALGPSAALPRRTTSMKAAVLYKANEPLRILDLEQQGPQAGEARVKVMATGVCHSDWHIMNGDWPLPLPMVLGHEAAGIVEELGPGVTNVKVGDHIIFSFRPHCGRCLYCSTGRSVLCDGYKSARFGMLDGSYRLKRDGQDIFQLARLGTFSEFVVCPAEMLVPVRREMPWAQAALMGCCVPTGVGAVTRCANVEAGASVVVIGCGGVGLNVVQGARLAGAGMIIAC